MVKANARVLIVEDEDLISEYVNKLLREKGYRTYSALTGKVALEWLQKEKIDLILLDLVLPDMKGVDILIKVKADEKLRHIPVVVLSAMQDDLGYFECINKGAISYIEKPINPIVLYTRVSNALQIKPRAAKKNFQSQSLHVIRGSLTSVNFLLEELVDICTDDEQRLIIKQCGMHLKKCNSIIDAWRNQQTDRVALIKQVVSSYYES